MNIIEEQEIKKEFQLERVILFSDAVFAIIITIMVLDIRMPEGIRHATSKEVQHAFFTLFPKIMAYSISFFLVAKFWGGHLKMFSLLKDYDEKLLRFNLFYLFSVSFFPFAVSLISGFVNPENPEYRIAAYTYVAIILLSTFGQSRLAKYLMDNRDKLCFAPDRLDEVLKYKALRLNFYLIPVVIVVLIVIGYLAVNPLFVLVTFMVYGVTMKRLQKHYYPKKDENGPILLKLFRPRGLRKMPHAANTIKDDKE